MLEFTKMHSLGNDFVMLNDVRRVLDLSIDQIQRIADRHRGIGCDQVIVAQSGQEGSISSCGSLMRMVPRSDNVVMARVV